MSEPCLSKQKILYTISTLDTDLFKDLIKINTIFINTESFYKYLICNEDSLTILSNHYERY